MFRRLTFSRFAEDGTEQDAHAIEVRETGGLSVDGALSIQGTVQADGLTVSREVTLGGPVRTFDDVTVGRRLRVGPFPVAIKGEAGGGDAIPEKLVDAGVWGSGFSGDGVVGSSRSRSGVRGFRTEGTGVSGEGVVGDGVVGQSRSAAGVRGRGSSGPGIVAENVGSGPALDVRGKAMFSRSGTALVPANTASVTVEMDRLSEESIVFALLQDDAPDTFVRATTVHPFAGSFVIHLSRRAARELRVAWFIVG